MHSHASQRIAERVPMTTGDDAVFEVHIPADPRWFHAHFPGQPIVPGVVLLAALEAGCRNALAGLGTLRAVRHLRFLQPVHAPATLRATVLSRGEWLHCALADPAVELDAAAHDPAATADAAPASTQRAGRRGAADVLRAQLQFDASSITDALTDAPATAATSADPVE